MLNLRRSIAIILAAAVLVAVPLLGIGAISVPGGALHASAQADDPLSSAGLAQLPIHLTQTARIRPTGQVRQFDLTARRTTWELVPGVQTEAITYNGTVPGPTIRVTEGDTLRVVMKNELDQDTSIHWHGLHVPNAMDGVPGLTQLPVRPGETFTYEYVVSHAGTFMYHPHINSVAQIDNGLYGLMIVDPQTPDPTRFDKEFTMVLGAWQLGSPSGGHGTVIPTRAGPPGDVDPLQTMRAMLEAGPADERNVQMAQTMAMAPEQFMDTVRGMVAMADAMHASAMGAATAEGHPMPGMEGMPSMMGMPTMPGMGSQGMSGGTSMNMNYNYFTVNGKAFPAVEPWTVRQGDLVRVRIVNISNLAHPMHLHGQDFKVIAKDGEPLSPVQQWVGNTLSIDAGETYDIVFLANNPGRWTFHCHELHHTENDGVEPGGLMQIIQYEGFEPFGGATSPSPTQAPPSMPGMGH